MFASALYLQMVTTAAVTCGDSEGAHHRCCEAGELHKGPRISARTLQTPESSPGPTNLTGGALCFLGGALLTARARTQSGRLQRPGPSRRTRGWSCFHLPRSVRMTVGRGRGMACQASCPSPVGRAGAEARAERVHPIQYRRGSAHRRTDPSWVASRRATRHPKNSPKLTILQNAGSPWQSTRPRDATHTWSPWD